LLLTAAALAGGSKTGQKAINATLANRSPFFDKLGNSIVRNRGLFGSATLPLALQAQ
jgi:hypothetical protein